VEEVTVAEQDAALGVEAAGGDDEAAKPPVEGVHFREPGPPH
jgi:hypothetical protein